MIAIDALRSPCCGVRLDARDAGTLACGGCETSFAMRTFGPDLMPPDVVRRYDSYPQWQAVQEALTAWRTRTWTGTPAAAARTDRTVQLAEAFVAWAGIGGDVIDIGCGGGWLRRMMPGAAYHGLDPMPIDQEYPFPFVRGIADRLPFPDASFDTGCFFSSIDYAIDIDATLAEARRVLKPGGRFICLEFSQVVLPLLKQLYDLYSFRVLPWMGRIVAGDRDSYVYLVESIRRFPAQGALIERMGAAGLGRASYRNLSGGIAALHSAWRI
jgi:ubiquinone/menaquinone biosynthesis methyltransferase